MEAKDRITKTTEENCHNTLEERLAEQDRISYKAGYENGIKEEQSRLLKYLKGLLGANPKASLEATIDLIETTAPPSRKVRK